MERVRKLLELTEPDYNKIPTFEQLKQGKPVYGGGWENDINSDVVDNYATKFFRQGKVGSWKMNSHLSCMICFGVTMVKPWRDWVTLIPENAFPASRIGTPAGV
jgi:hypothetical protein